MTSGTLAVISQTGESLSFFSLPEGKLVSRLDSLIAEPHELAHDRQRKVLYMSHAYRHGNYWQHGDFSHEISVVDIETRTVVDVIDTRPAKGPHGLHIDQDRDILYTSVEYLPGDLEGGGVVGIDLKTRKVVKAAPSAYRTHWFVMTRDGKKAYCCNKTAPFISVLDLENERMVGKIDVPGCEEPSMSPDGRYAYFPTPGFSTDGKDAVDPKIQLIDTTTDRIVQSINLKHGTLPVHVTSTGTILAGQYIFGESANGGILKVAASQMAIYDGGDHTLLGEVPIGLLPLTIRSSADGKTAFAATVRAGTVSVVDLVSKSVVRTIEVDGQKRKDKNIHVGAHGMAFIE